MSARIALPALMVAAGWRSAGKTTLCVGIGAALARRGIGVLPFKKGPDFIDPQWLTAATGHDCRNLDLRLQGAIAPDYEKMRRGNNRGALLIYPGRNPSRAGVGTWTLRFAPQPVAVVSQGQFPQPL